TEGSLYRINSETFELEYLVDFGTPVSAMGWYGDRYYVALAAQGFRTFDSSFSPQSVPNGLQSLQGMKIRGWTPGQEQLLWVATDGNGFVRISQYNSPFRTLSSQSGLSLPPVRAIAEIDGDLWVGTKGG